tara:strand:- start:470 stop:691 length:222 start_codon:yes stop_codon:yes gene_type:complete
MNWVWSLFGYKSANDLKRKMILDHQFARAVKWKEQEAKIKTKGWSEEYAKERQTCVVKIKKGVDQIKKTEVEV